MALVFPYWAFPLVSAFTWLGMLLAMLIVWLTEHSPHYASFNTGQKIAYISDIGAQGLKPLFIAGSCVTVIFLDLSLLSERWLRHRGVLARNSSVTEKVLVSLSLVFALIGSLGLILLSIFDTLRHPSLHRLFLLFFMGGYVISAIFVCWEYQRLGIHFREHAILRISFWIKLIFILVEIVLAIVFGVLLYKGISNIGAVFEWVISLIFTGYIFSFFIDLLPAVRVHHHKRQSPEFEMTGANGTSPTDRYKSEYSNGSAATTQPNGVMSAENGHANANGFPANGRAQATNVHPTAAQNF